MKEKSMNILITSAGRRVSLVKAFQKELKKVNAQAQVIATDSNPLLAAACHVADAHFQVPRLNAPNYIEKLIEQCKLWHIDLVIPTIDTELFLLSKNRELLEKNQIQVLVSSSDFIEKCRDKRIIHEFFKSNGISVAQEYPKNNFPIPMFIKPSDGSRSVNTFLITSKDELKEHHLKNDKMMFLEYLDHKVYDEYTCDLYYSKDHFLKCAVPRKRLETRDGEVSKGLTRRNALVPYLQKHLGYIDGAVGCLTAQFFVNNKNESDIYGIEINPRFGGGYPLSYLANANFPKWIIQEYFLHQKIEDQFESWEDNLLMIRYDDEILVHGYQG
jgi:carbamoyl-phosphate synthase large subunit